MSMQLQNYTCGTWIAGTGKLAELQRARFWCEFEMRRESDNELLVTSRQSLSLVQMPEGKPVRLPKEWNWSVSNS